MRCDKKIPASICYTAADCRNILPQKPIQTFFMVITFRINYHTQWGETIGVEILNTNETVILSTADGEHWEGSHQLAENVKGTLHYRFCVFVDEERTRVERGNCQHVLTLPKDGNAKSILLVNDAWRDLPACNYLFSSAFSGDFQVSAASTTEESSPLSSITLRVLSPCLHQKGLKLGIVGGSESLGEWKKPLVFTEILPNQWELTLDLYQLEGNSEYKFVAIDTRKCTIVEWEEGENRRLYVPQLDQHIHYFTPERELYLPSTLQKIAGTAVPVFSLRTEGSQGVGDFGDLKKMIDWAVKTGQRALQILPINDTTMTGSWIDSYPYKAISIYAFHPMFVDLRQVGPLSDSTKEQKYQKTFRQLNALTEIDYESVNKAKRDYLRLAFREKGEKMMQSKEYKDFYRKNEDWLIPYAAFSVLRDKYNTADFNTWPELSTYNADEVRKFCTSGGEGHQGFAYYCYIQYLLHRQLLDASQYARENGVILKGDIPIGVSRHSVEAWYEPYYFNMNGQAGAPPDAFSTTGQNWGFPTYNWDVMRQDGYLWWKRRFAKMAEYFTAYRIDHILGFFRIWEIPIHSVQGILGQFSPSLPMTKDEIESYGLKFDKYFMTRPFINDEILARVFGGDADYVRTTFLQHSHYDVWSLRPEYATQRDVLNWFNREGGRKHNAEYIRDGLYTLIDNVLFVPDNKESDKYHPRITAFESLIFERLNANERQNFMRLYNHYYYERHNEFWYKTAMEKLPELLEAEPMLPCGEDLGMVPDCVPWVMNELQILSLEIERMPKDPKHEFGHVWEYPVRSVCTIGTHDMSTFRGWWKEDAQQTSRYYHNVMCRGGNVPEDAPGWVCEDVVRRHLNSPSLLAILALQDWLAIDEKLRLPNVDKERINVPANPKHYWRYRMHISIESLLRQDAFNEKMKGMIGESGRA